MFRYARALGALGMAMAIAGVPAAAHHSFAMFDADKEITLKGTIKDFQWANPHSWVRVLVRSEANGKDVDWAIETWGAGSLSRQGFKRTSMKPGDQAVMVIHPLKDGSAGGQLVSVTVNGQKVGTQARIQDKI